MPITLFDPSTQEPLTFESGAEAKDAIIQGIASFDPNQQVYLKDSSGSLVKSTGKDAIGYIAAPDSEYSLASDEDIFKINKERKFGTPIQQAITGAEGVANAATLGFGKVLTKTALDLATPKGNTLAKQYGEAAQSREETNPASSLAGEVGGLVIDPLGAGSLVTKGTGKLVKGASLGVEKVVTKVPKAIEKIITAPVVKSIVEKGAQFGTEGAIYGGTFETGRQLVDDAPLNADAIISNMKEGAVLGSAIGVGFGAGEAAASKALKETKKITKKYIDKITGANAEQAGEIFSEIPTNALKRDAADQIGRRQKAIKLTEEGEGIYKYTDPRKEGIISSISPEAKVIDLSDMNQINELGEKLGIDDLAFKLKNQKLEDESLHQFLKTTKIDQEVQDAIRSNATFMEEADRKIIDSIKDMRERFKNLKSVTPTDLETVDAMLNYEKKIIKKYELFPKDVDFEKAYDNFIRKNLSEYDVIKTLEKDGKKSVFVYNENMIPKTINVKNLGKGVVPLSYEAGQMSGQLKMTPQQMIKKGNQRLNEITEFILDRYPQQGSFLKKVTTSADYIAEEINTVKNKAINAIDESVDEALNIGGTRQRITNQDIAKHIETNILPRFTDIKSGNPIAGLEKEYKMVKDFADGYKNNGYTLDKYGSKTYVPLNVKELRDLRINLDNIAKYNKAEANALQDAAKELRHWIEDEVMSRVGKLDDKLLQKYKAAKRDYGLAEDAGKIVNGAAKKAAKDTNFSLFYSSIGAASGAGIGGPTGAIIGGLVGGAARNMMREYSGALKVFLARNIGKNVETYENLIQKTAKAFFRPIDSTAKTYIKVPKDTDEEVAKTDYKRLMMEVSDRETYMSNFVDNNEDLFAEYPETSNKVLQTTLRARDFLLTKIPQNPYVGNPFKESGWTPSPYEMNKYMRYREAVNNPAIILKQIKDGYVTPEGIEVLDKVYPDTKQALMKQFIEEAAKIKNLPVEKRVELFKVFGIKLDYFMDGIGFAELQAESNKQAQESANNGGNFKPQNSFKTNLGKKDTTLGNDTVR